jgi:hypothetical protein
MVFQRRPVLRSRQGRAEQECRSEREPEREAALPPTTHEGGPYQRKRLVALRTNLNVFSVFWPETAEIREFVRSRPLPERVRFRLGKRLQTSEDVARVPNLCGPAPSGTVPVDSDLASE